MTICAARQPATEADEERHRRLRFRLANWASLRPSAAGLTAQGAGS